MDWRFTPAAAPLLVGAGLLLLIAGIALARHRARGALAMALVSFAIGVYVVGYLLELGSLRLESVARCLAFDYLGIANVPPLLLVLVLAYTGRARLLNPLAVATGFAVPAVTCVLAFSNGSHELIWRGLRIDTSGAFTRTLFQRGPWYWIHNAYAYLLIAASLVFLVRALLRGPGLFRRQAAVMLFGLLVPIVVHLSYSSRPVWSGLDPNPYALLVTALAFAWGMFAYGLWDIGPVAREAVLASMGAAVIVVDRRGRLADLNPAAWRLLDVSPESVLGRPLAEALPAVAALAAEDAPKELVVARAGETRRLDVITTPLAERGRVRGRLYLLRDVTDERRAEAALKESEARVRSLLETAPDAIVISDPEGRITLVNRQAEATFGYERDEMLGLRIEDLVPERLRSTHASQRASYVAKPSLRPMGVALELHARRKDGSELPVEISLSPVATAAGLLITSIVRDLTTRKRVEEQLRLQGVALEAAANAIVITDRAGRILWVNPAFTRMTGYTPGEVVGRNPSLLKSGSHGEEFYRALWATILAGEVWSGETINRRKDGVLYTEEQAIAPVRDERGEISHFIAVKQDVSHRKLAEAQREGMARTMVHDLRSPLTVILGGIELALLSSALPESTREVLEAGRRNSERMLELLGAILELYRLQSGQATLERSKVAPVELVAEALRLLAPRATAKGQSLAAELPAGLPDVNVDRALLSRVLQNLLDNALKFTPEGGRIRVSGQVSGTELVLCVSDEGPGITGELRGRLFREFASGTIEGHGTGLGLAFCRQAVEAHQGRIWLEPSTRGTAVAFSLPTA